MISDSIDFRPSYNFESDRRKLLNFFFLIDTSRSMCMDGKIDIVNEWLEKVVSALRETVLGNLSKFELRIAVMTFAENARWIVPPTSVLEYRYKEIECGKYDVNFGSAFRSLGEKLTRKEYMAHTGKIVRPYIILMTGSRPTEQDNYEPELDKLLLENGWFMRSQRFAVLVGDGNSDSTSVRSVAEKFVSSPVEGIIALEDAMEIFVEASREIDRKIVTPAPSPLKEPLEINDDFYGKSDDYICDNLDWDNLDGDVFI